MGQSDKSHEMGQFPQNRNYPNSSSHKTDHLNSPMTIKDIEIVTLKTSKKIKQKTSRLRCFHWRILPSV